jgi:hypothetical protein
LGRKAKWIWSGVFLSIFLIVIIVFFYPVILSHAGTFMACDGSDLQPEPFVNVLVQSARLNQRGIPEKFLCQVFY